MTVFYAPVEEGMNALALGAMRVKARAAMPIAEWRNQAREAQMPPDGDWHIWYVRGGRGSGKTWTGSHTLAEWAQQVPGEYAVVGPTFADARDTGVEGQSGLLASFGTSKVQVDRGASPTVASWNRSMGDMRLRNGSVIFADGADDGAPRIQGKNLRGAWCDEIGLWKNWKMAWTESIRYAVRLSPARIVATGTPKRAHPLVKLLMGDEAVRKTLMLTMDNAEHLDAAILAELVASYGGTEIGRQELEGAVLEAAEGVIWVVPENQVRDEPGPWKRVVAGIDWGFVHAFAAEVVGQSGTGRLAVIDEVYERGETIDRIIPVLRFLMDRHGVTTFYADPSEPAYIVQCQRAGIPIEPAQNDVGPGIGAVTKAIADGLTVAPSCSGLLGELPGYTWAPNRAGGFHEKPIDQNDDACDALRYAVVGITGALSENPWAQLAGQRAGGVA